MSEKIKEYVAGENLNSVTGNEIISEEQIEKPGIEKKKSGRIKWIFIILVMLMGISGLGIKYAPDRFSFFMKKKFIIPEVSIDEDNLREETLSPFFIPPGPAGNTIRIDLSVIWDGLASIRFKKKEFTVRNMMYEKIYTIAEQNRDLNEKIPYLENEVSSMLRSSLGVQNLAVNIKEIRYF